MDSNSPTCRIRSGIISLLSLAGLLLWVSCTSPSTTPVPETKTYSEQTKAPASEGKVVTPQTGRPLKIGAIFAASGPYAPMGEPNREAAFLAVERINAAGGINGRPLVLVFEDNQGDPSVGGSLAKRMITQDKVSALFGGPPLAVAHVVASIAEESRVPIVFTQPTRSLVKGRRFAFHLAVPEDTISMATTKYIVEKGKWRRVAIVADTTEYSQLLIQFGEEELRRLGAEVTKEQFQPNSVDAGPLVTRLQSWKPDGVYLIGGVPSFPAVFAKEMKSRMPQVAIIAAAGLASRKFLQLAGDAAGGIFFENTLVFDERVQPSEEKELFRALARKSSGSLPLQFHALGWDGINVLAKGLEKGGDDPMKVRDAIESLSGYRGVMGVYNFSPIDHNGHSPSDVTILRVEQGKFVFVNRPFTER